MILPKIRCFVITLLIFAWNHSSAVGYEAGDSFVVADMNGNTIVVWSSSDLENNALQIRANAYTVANGWSGPFAISSIEGQTSVASPKVAIDSTGNVLVAWLAYITSSDSFLITTKTIAAVTGGSWGSLSVSQTVNDPNDYAQSNFKLLCQPNDSFTMTWDANIGKTGNAVIQTSTISAFNGTWPSSPTTVSDI